MAKSNSSASASGGWEATDNKADFKRAAEWMRRNKTLKLSTDEKLTLYGLFKQVMCYKYSLYCLWRQDVILGSIFQANEGPCTTAKPGIFDMTGRAKW
jgi:acyl-CoA-binding protein